jgi:ADP-ribose pyrophosphatase YjhB (NUDIX family)
MTPRRFAGVLARHADAVVLVRESHAAWGGEFWNIPSGHVEEHETPVLGAARELAEETGLVVAPDRLRQVGTSSTTDGPHAFHAWNFTTEVEDPTLAVADPDGLIREARWFARDEAVEVLRRLPYRPLADPAIAVLLGEVATGTHWTFAHPHRAAVLTAPSDS